MAFFYFDARVPTDTYTPREHVQEEYDAMLIPQDRRDGCKDFYMDFKQCIMVQHQTKANPWSWKKAGREHCGYYFDHWNFCREKRTADLGLSTKTNSV